MKCQNVFLSNLNSTSCNYIHYGTVFNYMNHSIFSTRYIFYSAQRIDDAHIMSSYAIFFCSHCSVNASVVYLLKWFKPCWEDKVVHLLRGFILITLMTRILNTSDTDLFLHQLTQVGRLSLLRGHKSGHKTRACCHFPLGCWEKGVFKSIHWFLRAQFETCMSRFLLCDTEYSKSISHVFHWDSEKLAERQYFCTVSSFLPFQKTCLQKNLNNKPEKIDNLGIYFFLVLVWGNYLWKNSDWMGSYPQDSSKLKFTFMRDVGKY